MNCQRCQSKRVARVNGKVSDCCSIELDGFEHFGYVPKDLGIGGDDYLGFSYCLDCGQLQKKFPLEKSSIEKDLSDEELVEFVENNFDVGQPMTLNQRQKEFLIEEAIDYCPKFSGFLIDFFKNPRPFIVPTAEQFIKMYRDNNPELEDN